MRHGGHQVLQHVSGQGEFREDDQVGAFIFGALDIIQVLFQVAFHHP